MIIRWEEACGFQQTKTFLASVNHRLLHALGKRSFLKDSSPGFLPVMATLGNLKAFLLTAGSPVWRMVLRLRGVEVGTGFTCIGRPGINRTRGSRIILGRNVTLCNSGMANPVAEGGRCRLATLAPGAEIHLGDGAGLSSTLICAARKVEIGEGTQIGGGAMILDTDFHPRHKNGTLITDPAAVSDPVIIGKNCFIGAKAIILKGVTIGEGSTIGAGAVVTRNIPPGAVAVGNPAKVVSHTAYPLTSKI